ncbi:Helix-turn-helix transcriptional regulator [Hyphomicrobiales bacterium]|nr:Helix-turn-helix transcriptional regulator [Hyphomicrobiales bacterium]CAH1697350.1 Helix-turn-helix transcriptional regulator [Hyphomicrobiales bacterium]CAI0345537.1 Helix-turn-helix transcriptional regulator [Hyphomicrobiales bacterium]
MSQIPLARCQFLIPFTSIHDEIGAPTVSLLEKLRLPTSLEEKADDFMPLLRAVEFAERAQRSQGIVDFGFQAAKRLQFCHLSAQLRRIIGCSPTLFTALQQICKWATLEDNVLSIWLERADDHIKICSKLIGTAGLAHLEHSQWLQNIFLIHIVRQFAGPEWAPTTIAFEARYVPSLETQACWPNTRFLSGQHASWIEVPLALMGVPSPVVDTPFGFPEGDVEANGGEIISSLKLMLPAYLDERIPTVAEIAEMARTSVRSLQRKLSAAGLTYSDLLEAARYEKAAKLLRSTDIKVIDVAFASGYADPAHFTRAFRRMSGTTPRRFRNEARPG